MRRLFLISLLALAACVAAPGPPAQRFAGELNWSFETSAFNTDDGQGPWWLTADGSVWRQVVAPIRAASDRPWGRVHIVVEGELSDVGHFGHMGAYERSFRVTRVIETRLVEPQSR